MVVLLLPELVDVDVERVNERVHSMRDVGLVLALPGNNDRDDDRLHDFDQMLPDMCIDSLDQFEFVWLWMDCKIQNEVCHLKLNINR